MEKFQKLKSTRNATIAKCLYNSRLWRWIVQRQPREFKAPESTAALPCKSFTPECGQTVVWFDFKPMMVLESPPMALEPRACWVQDTIPLTPHRMPWRRKAYSLRTALQISEYHSLAVYVWNMSRTIVLLLCYVVLHWLTACLPCCLLALC